MLAKVPGPQATHEAEPGPVAKVPAEQEMQASAPAAENFPGWQREQLLGETLPGVAKNVPAMHGVHSVRPSDAA